MHVQILAVPGTTPKPLPSLGTAPHLNCHISQLTPPNEVFLSILKSACHKLRIMHGLTLMTCNFCGWEAFSTPGALTHTRITWALSLTAPQVPCVTQVSPSLEESLSISTGLATWPLRFMLGKCIKKYQYDCQLEYSSQSLSKTSGWTTTKRFFYAFSQHESQWPSRKAGSNGQAFFQCLVPMVFRALLMERCMTLYQVITNVRGREEITTYKCPSFIQQRSL